MSEVAVPSKVPTPPSQGAPRRDKILALNEEKDRLPDLRSSDLAIDRTKPLPTSLQSDFLPEDVLFALTQPPQTKEPLGPASRFRNLNTSVVKTRKTPANVWNSARRDKFRHLTDNTPCTCGAGKDISFLYDVPKPDETPARPDKIDKSVVRKDGTEPTKQALQLPDTLIPSEYHVVKNKGVMGIEYHDDKYSNQVEDHEKHLVIFPSMKPVSRFEVMQLQKTMEEMLEKSGVNDADTEIRGPTQMHNLLELIKKEQNIYNIVFHELIRQASIECIERGQLLADLRDKYSSLLNRVPQQIKSLHEEVMAQRALDRRLTEELMRFKSTISVLTSELSEVKDHDKRVTQEAQQAQEDLKAALNEAQKNASLLAEYHELYELQRRRLESQVFMLTEERELWSTAAYSLAMKVTEEAQLTTAKRLHVSEKAWAKLANHFTILLSDKDTDLLTKIQTFVETWRDMTEEFSIAMRHREEDMRKQLRLLEPGIDRWMKELKNCFTKDGHFIKPPEEKTIQMLLEEIRKWEELLGKETEKFGGDTLLNGQEQLHQIKQQMDGWTDSALRVFSRHRGLEGRQHPDQVAMVKLNEEVDELLHQFNTRLTGENGVATNVIHLMNGMETWDMKLASSLNGTMPIHDMEWGGLCQLMEDWLSSITEAVEYVGSTQREESRAEGLPHTRNTIRMSNGLDPDQDRHSVGPDLGPNCFANVVSRRQKSLLARIELKIPNCKQQGTDQTAAELSNQCLYCCLGLLARVDVNETVRKVQKWVTTATNAIDSEDAKLVEQVSTLHSEMIRWMVQVLLRLAPDKEGNSKEAKEIVLLGSATLNQLHANAKTLFEQLEVFSKYVYQCCSGIVMDNTQLRRDLMEENADHELKDLQRLRTECDDWMRTAKILLSKLMNEPIHDLFPVKMEEKKEAKSVSLTLPTDQEYVDQEKLVPTGEEQAQTTQENEPEKAPTEEGEVKKEGEEETKEEQLQEVVEQEAPKLEPSPSGTASQTELKEGEEKLEVIGGDDNTHVQTLEQRPSQPFVTGEVKAPQVPSAVQLSPGQGPDVEKAFEALAAVGSLQQQLISTEERAQAAEERASNAEAELNLVLEKLRTLEKKVAETEHEDAGTSDKKQEEKEKSKTDSKPVTPKTPKTPSTRPHSKEGSEDREKKRPDSQVSKGSKSAKKKK